MTVKVYIWMENNDRWGHASLVLSNGTYVSWWPPEDKNHGLAILGKKKNRKNIGKCQNGGSTCSDFAEDIENEEGPPDYQFEITGGLDEEAMERWWVEWSGEGHYEATSSNCCWAVYTCLVNGGAASCKNVPWYQDLLIDYLKKCKNCHSV